MAFWLPCCLLWKAWSPFCKVTANSLCSIWLSSFSSSEALEMGTEGFQWGRAVKNMIWKTDENGKEGII